MAPKGVRFKALELRATKRGPYTPATCDAWASQVFTLYTPIVPAEVWISRPP